MRVYRSVAARAQIELEVKKSIFHGWTAPVEEIEGAFAFLGEAKERYPDATHHVWAYRLGFGGEQQRCSDDGEPSGTAGRPVLEVLNKREITGVAVVVTRYFGGTLLGAGGLVRAYGQAAQLAVEAAGIATYQLQKVYRLSLEYSQWGAVEQLLKNRGLSSYQQAFTDLVEVFLRMPEEGAESLMQEIADLTAGGFLWEEIREEYAPI